MARNETALSQSEDSVNQRKLEFAQHIGMGLNVAQAGKAVGLKERKSAYEYMDDPVVIAEIERVRADTLTTLSLRREDLHAMTMEAIDMARMMSDPMAMIRGVQELNKMLGFYAPEEKKITLNKSQKRIAAKYDDFSDDELLVMASEESGVVIEGAEYEEVKEADGK